MNLNQLKNKINLKLNEFNQKISELFNFIIIKLKNFKNLTLGEQLSFGLIGAGILLVFVAIILFIL